MGRIILMIVISLCMGLPIFGQKKVSASEQASMVKTVEKAASSLKTMQCKFRQTKKLSLLNDKMVSTGVMYYSQPAKLRWQYMTPYNYTFVINGTKVMMKTGGRKNVIDARQSKMFKEITQIMVNSVTGKCLSNKKEFKTTMYKSSKEWTAHLVPMTKELKIDVQDHRAAHLAQAKPCHPSGLGRENWRRDQHRAFRLQNQRAHQCEGVYC